MFAARSMIEYQHAMIETSEVVEKLCTNTPNARRIGIVSLAVFYLRTNKAKLYEGWLGVRGERRRALTMATRN